MRKEILESLKRTLNNITQQSEKRKCKLSPRDWQGTFEEEIWEKCEDALHKLTDVWKSLRQTESWDYTASRS